MKRAKKRVSTDTRNTEVIAFSHLSRLEKLVCAYVNTAIAQDKTSGPRKGGLDFTQTGEVSLRRESKQTNHKILWQQICNYITISQAEQQINPSTCEICYFLDLFVKREHKYKHQKRLGAA